MGSDDADAEKPIHKQVIEQPYWIAQFPVTNGQWQQAVQAGAVGQPYNTGNALSWYQEKAMIDAPVVGVDWFMARDYATWMNCRLPTEREWEYAARGVESWDYPWGKDWDPSFVVWHENSDGKPAVVMRNPKNKSWVATRHLIGNMWEWTNSIFEPLPYRLNDGREGDTGGSITVRRVLRGGSWWSTKTSILRASCRFKGSPDDRIDDGGLRLALSI